MRTLLGADELRWLVDRMRRRVEAGRPLRGQVRLAAPTPAQRATLARLLGRYPRGDVLVVALEELEALVRNAGGSTILADAVEVLCGDVTAHRAGEAARAAAWEAAFAPPADRRDAVQAWWEDLRRSGLPKRAAGGDPRRGSGLLRQALAVAARLPAQGVLLAELAAGTTGDAHALDAGAPLNTLVLRLLPGLTGTTGDRRALWAAAGVELDPVSTSALVLNLRAEGNGIVARLLAACAEVGEPCRLTLRQLREPGGAFQGEIVHVCENPTVLAAAADRLGRQASPLVCVEGRPRAAARALLAGLGGRLRYHGDLDWPGLQIAAEVMALFGAEPWRMGAADYQAAPKGAELAGPAFAASWDAELAPAMEACGRAVHEEAVLDVLLADLA